MKIFVIINFLGSLHIWGCFYMWIVLIFEVLLIFGSLLFFRLSGVVYGSEVTRQTDRYPDRYLAFIITADQAVAVIKKHSEAAMKKYHLEIVPALYRTVRPLWMLMWRLSRDFFIKAFYQMKLLWLKIVTISNFIDMDLIQPITGYYLVNLLLFWPIRTPDGFWYWNSEQTTKC